MTQLLITLPDDLYQFAIEQARNKGFATVSEYIVDLVRQDRIREEIATRIDQLAQEGLDSGEPIPITPEYWENKRQAPFRANNS